LLNRVISTDDNGTSRSSQMALASGRWAEPLKTTTLVSGTGTPGAGPVSRGQRIRDRPGRPATPPAAAFASSRGRTGRAIASAHAQSWPRGAPRPRRWCPRRRRREVLPAAVGDHERDVGALTRLDRLGGPGPSAACRIAPVEMPAKMPSGRAARAPAYGVARGRPRSGVDQVGVVQLGDEALVEVAQAVDQLAVPRLGGDDPHSGLATRKNRLTPIRVPGRAEPGTKWVMPGGPRGSPGRCPSSCARAFGGLPYW
jgi:hypothetical protein